MKTWQLQEAKAKLSEVVKATHHHGAQTISVHGKEIAVIISKKMYDQLVKPRQSFTDFMQNSPLKSVNLSTKRDKSSTRDIEL